ncbi:hypothetical protein IFM89_009985 [Coptis chinensis]|uniref:Uncharacterized protein n=1 Tax=Coptis chinensis TaxID=261450 RepID=A0A835LV20_9MAGN|nr:hypothetical protein IFM89_009985 [Coptis chinensis]
MNESFMGQKQLRVKTEFNDSQPSHDIIRDLALIDLRFKRYPFTWSSRRLDQDNIRKRLDRALSTTDWSLLFPAYTLHHLPAISSNHCPLLLNTHPILPSYQKPFIFHHMWIDHQEYHDVISHTWQRVHITNFSNPHLAIPKHLNSTKKALKRWVDGDRNFWEQPIPRNARQENRGQSPSPPSPSTDRSGCRLDREPNRQAGDFERFAHVDRQANMAADAVPKRL